MLARKTGSKAGGVKKILNEPSYIFLKKSMQPNPVEKIYETSA